MTEQRFSSLAECRGSWIHLFSRSFLSTTSTSLLRFVDLQVLDELCTSHGFIPAQRGQCDDLGRMTCEAQGRGQLKKVVSSYGSCSSPLTHCVMKLGLSQEKKKNFHKLMIFTFWIMRCS